MDLISKYILCVYEKRNITKAAVELGISQPALSSALNMHEKKLGYSIFNRKANPITVTPEGEAYIAYIFEGVNLEKDLERKISEIQQSRTETLSIGAPSAYINAYILPVLRKFTEDCPECCVRIVEGTISRLSEAVRQGKLDYFISTTSKLSAEFRLEFVSKELIYLCVPKQIRTDGRDMQTLLESLSGENFILLGESQPLQIQADAFFRKYHFRPESRIRADQTAAAVNLAANGCGVCLAAGEAFADDRYREKLNIYPLPEEDFPRNIYLASLSNAYFTETHKHFVKLLIQHGGTINETF